MSDPIYYQVRCSECGFDLDPQTWHQELHQYDADKFCPKCGSPMMVEPQESEDKE
jgi:DNA-directed RNA polymerase subunit RPC12/RpoP